MATKTKLINERGAFIVCDLDNPSSIKILVLKKETKDTFIAYDGQQYYKDYCWPVQAEAQLREVITKRAALKKAYDDSISLVYQLSNAIAKGEIK